MERFVGPVENAPVSVGEWESRLAAPRDPTRYLARRRWLEIGLILAASPVLVVLGLGAAWLSWWKFGHPFLLAQERIGKDGKRFCMYKLRSLAVLPENEPVLVARDDARVEKFGAWLRRHKLDELPQVWNVLKGEMSLIGPRPVPAFLAPTYEQAIPCYTARYRILPGMTGWAQVRLGYTSDLAGESAKLEYDLFYLQNASPRLDVEILWQTACCALTGENAR